MENPPFDDGFPGFLYFLIVMLVYRGVSDIIINHYHYS